jgi:hypothetical protein
LGALVHLTGISIKTIAIFRVPLIARPTQFVGRFERPMDIVGV